MISATGLLVDEENTEVRITPDPKIDINAASAKRQVIASVDANRVKPGAVISRVVKPAATIRGFPEIRLYLIE